MAAAGLPLNGDSHGCSKESQDTGHARHAALIAGLVFVFIWEGAISGIFEGVRFLSIRHYMLGLSDWISDTPDVYLDAYVGGVPALILTAIVITLGAAYANERLARVEIREST